eukprot:10281900-Alexandrium_andersonii.AAC.1
MILALLGHHLARGPEHGQLGRPEPPQELRVPRRPASHVLAVALHTAGRWLRSLGRCAVSHRVARPVSGLRPEL